MQGKGKMAVEVHKQMQQMRLGEGEARLDQRSSSVHTCVLLDRREDLVTPMLT